MGRDSPSLVEDGERNVASSKRPPRCVLRQRGATLLFDLPSRGLTSRGENPEQRTSLTDDSANNSLVDLSSVGSLSSCPQPPLPFIAKLFHASSVVGGSACHQRSSPRFAQRPLGVKPQSRCSTKVGHTSAASARQIGSRFPSPPRCRGHIHQGQSSN